jgi:hypothetical protein
MAMWRPAELAGAGGWPLLCDWSLSTTSGAAAERQGVARELFKAEDGRQGNSTSPPLLEGRPPLLWPPLLRPLLLWPPLLRPPLLEAPPPLLRPPLLEGLPPLLKAADGRRGAQLRRKLRRETSSGASSVRRGLFPDFDLGPRGRRSVRGRGFFAKKMFNGLGRWGAI